MNNLRGANMVTPVLSTLEIVALPCCNVALWLNYGVLHPCYKYWSKGIHMLVGSSQADTTVHINLMETKIYVCILVAAITMNVALIILLLYFMIAYGKYFLEGYYNLLGYIPSFKCL